MEHDTIFRMFSMTKPITSVAAMMLYEEGAFELKDPVGRFIPSFGGTRVLPRRQRLRPVTEPVTEPMRIWHLLTHTAGLTYGFQYASPVDAMYRSAGFEWGTPPGLDLAGCCDAWASLPLLFQPGTEWSYSVATDVLGRVVEVASGLPLDRFFDERIFGPLGMVDTGFHVPPATPAAWPRSTCPIRPPARRSRWTRSGPAALAAARGAVRRRRAGRHGGRLPPLRRDAAPGRRAGRRPAARHRGPSTT